MSIQIYVDGKYYPKEEAKISVFDHGFLYGDGVFEGIRAYNGRVFKLKEHIDRLYNGARGIMINVPLTKEEMTEVVLETLRRNQLQDAYIRLVISRGAGDLGLDPKKCSKPTVVCIADKIVLYPEELYEKGMEIITAATRRNRPEGVNPQMKSLNYLNNIMAKLEANLAGAPEALLLNNEDYVAECTGDNIFIVKNGVLITPPPYVGILVGITRNAIIEAAERLGIKVEEKVFTRYEVFTADECFLSGTAAEAVPVVKVDGRPIADGKPGPITKQIIKEFKELIKTEGTEIYK
ncbi:branched chain amino acid aminotransferase [Tepidanaerobacter syntrophicus]|uniref:Branched-chain-amino-acid aminotransferase n=1 Tax=Tepidanaerobacter syntrophicus TaxID=224999 RepID=A0A0U9HCB8_9FIRM|nr:branched-chain-amino-acid transaminase [Tepidanaerobacter syntrophicus]GAQ24437.1 branched-chain amino acid aminotransferase [Tepidanaerobacter syntrophicus]GLI18264.1 branched chain amino acid aminotransferase [Tepidanaerobacter syntrophicus]GLI52037.1 branched chain amino acid aminotransferase [Tepidanaerobacter syntrophicus]